MASQLKLQVLLAAVDKITRPLKSIQKAAGLAAKDVSDTQRHIKELNKQAGQIDGYRKVSRQVGITGNELKKLQQTYQGLGSQIKQTEVPSKQLTQEFERAKSKYQQVMRQQRQNIEVQNRHKAALTAAGINTKNLKNEQQGLTNQLGQANRALEQQKTKLERLAQQQKRLAKARQTYDNTKQLQGQIAGQGAKFAAGGAAATYGAARLLAPGIGYGEQMSELQAVSRLTKDDERYKKLAQQSRDLGATTAFSATEVGAGQTFLARAGFTPEAIHASLQDVLNMALANGTDLAQTADIASNIGGVFKLDPEAEGNMARIGDVLSGVSARANVDLAMLGDTMKYLGSGSGLGLSLEEAAAMAGLLGNIGIQGSQAGTTLRAMANRLSGPAAAGAKAMAGLGLEVADAQGNMRKMPDIIKDVANATKDMGNVERAAIFTKIFGAEAGSGMAELIQQQGSDALYELIKDLENNTKGESAGMAATRADNLGGDLKGLKSAWEEVGISMAMVNDGGLRDLTAGITGVIRNVGVWINDNPKLVATLSKVFAVVASLSIAGGSLALTIAGLLGPFAALRLATYLLGIKSMPSLTKSFRSLSAGAVTMASKIKLAATQTFGFKAAVGRAIISTKAWIVAQRASVRATLAAGVANTKLGFSAVIRGLVVSTAALWRQVVAMGAYVTANGAMGTAINLSAASFSKLWLVLKGGLIGSLKMVGQSLLFVGRAALFNPVGLIITAIALAGLAIIKYWHPVKAFFSGFWQGLKEGLAPVADAFGIAFSAWAGVLAPLKPLWDGITWALSGAFGWISKLLTPLNATSEELAGATSAGKTFGLWLASIISFFPNVIASFTEFGGNLISGMINGISAKAGELKDKVAGMGESIKSWFKDPLGIKSPSKVFTQYGDDTMAGLANGLAKNHDPEQQVTGMAKKLKAAGAGLTLGLAAMPAAAELPDTAPAIARIQSQEQAQRAQGQGLSQAAPAQAKGVTQDFSIGHVEINITAAPGMDEQEIARQVQRALENHQRQQAARNRSRLGDLE